MIYMGRAQLTFVVGECPWLIEQLGHNPSGSWKTPDRCCADLQRPFTQVKLFILIWHLLLHVGWHAQFNKSRVSYTAEWKVVVLPLTGVGPEVGRALQGGCLRAFSHLAGLGQVSFLEAHGCGLACRMDGPGHLFMAQTDWSQLRVSQGWC